MFNLLIPPLILVTMEMSDLLWAVNEEKKKWGTMKSSKKDSLCKVMLECTHNDTNALKKTLWREGGEHLQRVKSGPKGCTLLSPSGAGRKEPKIYHHRWEAHIHTPLRRRCAHLGGAQHSGESSLCSDSFACVFFVIHPQSLSCFWWKEEIVSFVGVN